MNTKNLLLITLAISLMGKNTEAAAPASADSTTKTQQFNPPNAKTSITSQEDDNFVTSSNATVAPPMDELLGDQIYEVTSSPKDLPPKLTAEEEDTRRAKLIADVLSRARIMAETEKSRQAFKQAEAKKLKQALKAFKAAEARKKADALKETEDRKDDTEYDSVE